MIVDLSNYGIEIIRLVSKTDMSEVYQARQREMERLVCLKLSGEKASAVSLLRFHKEAQILTDLKHANIGQTYQFGTTADGRPFLVLEWLEGQSLADLLGQRQLTGFEVKIIFDQLVSALSAAHTQGVVHRDIKPSNIFICKEQGSVLPVKLIDFGIARQTESGADVRLTQTGAIVGSPAYMSPEQARGEVCGQASDQYSLACVVYQALTGRMVFEGNSEYEMMLRQSQDEPKLDALAKPLRAVLAKALAKQPADRYESVAQFWDAARDHLENFKLSSHALLITVGIGVVAFGLFFVSGKIGQRTGDKSALSVTPVPYSFARFKDEVEHPVKAFYTRRQFSKAREILDACFDSYKQKKNFTDEQLAVMCDGYLRIWREQRRQMTAPDQARVKEVVAIYKGVVPKLDGRRRSSAMASIGLWYQATGDLASAEQWLADATQYFEKIVGKASYDQYWQERERLFDVLCTVQENQKEWQKARMGREECVFCGTKYVDGDWYNLSRIKVALAKDLIHLDEKQAARKILEEVSDELAGIEKGTSSNRNVEPAKQQKMLYLIRIAYALLGDAKAVRAIDAKFTTANQDRTAETE